MLARHLQRIALALLTVAACSTTERGPANDTRGSRATADSSALSTYEMSQALTRDVRESDRELTAVEDSIYLFMGDTVSVLLTQARASWEQYRKLECDAIRVAFAQGTMAPIAQMECWVGLTDDHRRFLVEEFDYMRNGRTTRGKRAR
jgi:uncharacterized protein YecT (DUF1311 family)